MSDAIKLVSAAVHALQCERGCSAAVAQSDGALFVERLLQQRQVVDTTFEQLKHADGRHLSVIDTAETRRALKSVESHLREQRGHFMCSADVASVIDCFSQQVIAPLISLNVSLSSSCGADNGQRIAFQHFVQWKERMALERAYGVKSYCENSDEVQDTEVLRALIRKQKEFERAFCAMADAEQLRYVQHGSSELSAVIELTHSLVESAAGSAALAPLTLAGWYDLLSKRIDEMYRIEQRLIAHLSEVDSPLDSPFDRAEQAVLPTNLEPYREQIAQLPLLANIPLRVRGALLAQARVRRYTAAHTVQSIGKRPTHLQLVLSGWVKICSSNRNGDQAILQMIGPGDCVADAAIYQDVEASVQALVEQKTEMLLIPAQTVRDCLAEDDRFKTNALQRLSLRSQRQLQHIERTRLKSAQERVGWFLLSLKTEMLGAPIDEPLRITLPFNKATIASYLDMTPETFSRILKSFRQQGVFVNRNLVTVERPLSLCGYCDHEVASQCEHKTPECSVFDDDGKPLVVEFQPLKQVLR